MPTVVYVHGNGNKVRKELLRKQWDVALFGHPMPERATRMAYWASVRYPQPEPDWRSAEACHEPPPSWLEEDLESPTAEQFVDAALADAGGELGDVSHALRRWLLRAAYRTDALAEGHRFDVPAPSGVVDESVRDIWKRALRALLLSFFKDVHAYFGDCKERMRQVLRTELEATEGDVLIIGHSLGSIISYDVLHEWGGQALRIPLLTTVGSPLSASEIQELIEHPLVVPESVAEWRNVSSCFDPIAAHHIVCGEYDPAAKCTDVTVPNSSWSHHEICSYLHARGLREPILRLVRAPA